MNKRLLILFLFVAKISSAQFYLRGEVRDEHNKLLPNAKIVLHSTGYLYSSGGSGSFGILTQKKLDSLTVSLQGYQPVSIMLDATSYHVIVLKLLHSSGAVQKNKLLSITKDLQIEKKSHWLAIGESYSSLIENSFIETEKYPETKFAVRIDKASYSNVRRFLNMQSRVPSDAVRIEELLNYFNFGYTSPEQSKVFSFSSQLTDCPWNAHNQLLFVKLCATKLDTNNIPPGNLVFLIDVSGSMDMPNRLPLLKSAFKSLVDNLRDKDTIAIVVYGGATGVFLSPTSGSEKSKIRKAIEELQPGGSTPGASGILSAYQLAKNIYVEGGNNRVILATDGDFNVGQHTEEELEQLIISYKNEGIYLTCLGVGMGNYKDSKLEVLAKKGNGNFAYLDNETEAEKVLVKELTQTLYAVADNAIVKIDFDKKSIRQYRLIGYDNKLKALTDSISDIDGGEVGSGHSMMAIFEIMPQQLQSKVLGSVTINYQLPDDQETYQLNYDVSNNYIKFMDLPSYYQFATAVAMFGSLLKESPYAKNISWHETLQLANMSKDDEDPVQTEFIGIVEKARKIYSRKRSRR